MGLAVLIGTTLVFAFAWCWRLAGEELCDALLLGTAAAKVGLIPARGNICCGVKQKKKGEKEGRKKKKKKKEKKRVHQQV